MPPAAPVLGAHVRKSLEIAAVRPAFALGLRAATATIVPLVIGDATGQPIFGWMALGGWLCAIADPGGPHVLRARRTAPSATRARSSSARTRGGWIRTSADQACSRSSANPAIFAARAASSR